MTQAGNFTWCPLGCGSGQFHDAVDDNDNNNNDDLLSIVLCRGCNRQYCRRHLVAWHHEHTCDEYEQYLLDPEHSRSIGQTATMRREAEERALDLAEDDIRDAQHRFDALLLQMQRTAEEIRQAELERLERERRERKAREELERRRRAEEEARKRAEREKRKLEARKKDEEAKTLAAFQNGSGGGFKHPVKPCPNPKCKTPIEKKAGWYVIQLSPVYLCDSTYGLPTKKFIFANFWTSSHLVITCIVGYR